MIARTANSEIMRWPAQWADLSPGQQLSALREKIRWAAPWDACASSAGDVRLSLSDRELLRLEVRTIVLAQPSTPSHQASPRNHTIHPAIVESTTLPSTPPSTPSHNPPRHRIAHHAIAIAIARPTDRDIFDSVCSINAATILTLTLNDVISLGRNWMSQSHWL